MQIYFTSLYFTRYLCDVICYTCVILHSDDEKALYMMPPQTKLDSYRYIGKYLQIPSLPITLIFATTEIPTELLTHATHTEMHIRPTFCLLFNKK